MAPRREARVAPARSLRLAAVRVQSVPVVGGVKGLVDTAKCMVSSVPARESGTILLVDSKTGRHVLAAPVFSYSALPPRFLHIFDVVMYSECVRCHCVQLWLSCRRLVHSCSAECCLSSPLVLADTERSMLLPISERWLI